jgi:hypothetical protein
MSDTSSQYTSLLCHISDASSQYASLLSHISDASSQYASLLSHISDVFLNTRRCYLHISDALSHISDATKVTRIFHVTNDPLDASLISISSIVMDAAEVTRASVLVLFPVRVRQDS